MVVSTRTINVRDGLNHGDALMRSRYTLGPHIHFLTEVTLASEVLALNR